VRGSGWVREGVRGSEAAWRGPLIGGPSIIVPLDLVLNEFKLNQKYSKRFKWNENSPNLTDPKGVSPYSNFFE
jgi:hypothetical protein